MFLKVLVKIALLVSYKLVSYKKARVLKSAKISTETYHLLLGSINLSISISIPSSFLITDTLKDGHLKIFFSPAVF